jgi:hypothetical protein
MLTSDELAIVDHKLDRYMAEKAEQGRMSHLLIDRFRFGGLGTDPERLGSKLLTRFGRAIHLFFMITPPEALVERAWTRGLEFGRYKAVDDLLAHSVEAYTGLPQLFLTWAQRGDKSVHYEFLDNSVRLGERPRTVAFGRNGEMFVLSVRSMLDIERFARIRISATAPEQLYDRDDQTATAEHAGFLLRCVRGLRRVNFADPDSGRIYLTTAGGFPAWSDPAALAAAVDDPATRAGLLAVAPGGLNGTADAYDGPITVWDLLPKDRIRTVGSWGGAAARPIAARMDEVAPSAATMT